MSRPLRWIVSTGSTLALLSRLSADPLQAQTARPDTAAGVEAPVHGSRPRITPPPGRAAPGPIAARPHFFLAERVRAENYNWWPTDRANGAYAFLGSVLRFGVAQESARQDLFVELQNTTLLNLPTKAVVPVPQGQLGQGATYFATNGSQVASLFPKQVYVRLKDPTLPGKALKIGRFETSDAGETVPADPSLAWLKKNRLAERLIGPFGFSDVGRSFDGFEFSSNRKSSNVTLLGAFPTRGVFDLNGADTLTDVRLASLSLTSTLPGKRSAAESRLFAIYYEDVRSDVKIDDRTAPARAADRRPIRITTLGGSYLGVHDTAHGKLDTLLWYAGQFGEWGALRHGAFAAAGEVGFQWPNVVLRPWFRAGWFLGSGDGSGGNRQHGTFFPILPTPRLYARDPFYTEANIEDFFVQAILRSAPRRGYALPLMTIRADVHSLRLADSHDLWYSGGGAYDNAVFGYNGRPSNGKAGLATLLDVSLDYAPVKSATVSAYLAYANGGAVISSIYKSRDSLFSFLELSYRY